MSRYTLYSLTLLGFVTLSFFQLAFGQAGMLDPSFNPYDKGFGYGSGASDIVLATAIQSDGKIVVGGQLYSYNNITVRRFTRLNTDGSIDTSFVTGTGTNNSIYSLTIQSDDKILIGGYFSNYNGISRNRIARVNVDGSLDTTFDPGLGANDLVLTIAEESNGNILLGGIFTSYDGVPVGGIVRLNPDGSIDNFFNSGVGFNGSPAKIIVLPNGKILVVGYFTDYNGTTVNQIVRLNSDGTIDNSFNIGSGANDGIYTASIQSDGKIIIAGEFTEFNGIIKNGVARLNTDGSLDLSFDPGLGLNDLVYSVSIQSSGKIILGGLFTTVNGFTSNHITRLNPDGSLDNTFAIDSGANNWVHTSSIQSNDKILIGGAFSEFSNSSKRYLVRLNSDGTIDQNFNKGTGVNGLLKTSNVLANEEILIGGSFSVVDGVERKGIAILNSDGSINPNFEPDLSTYPEVSTSSVQDDGKIIIGGLFSTVSGISSNNIARLNLDGSLDQSFNTGSGANGDVLASAIQSDDKILIGGYFDHYNGTNVNSLARLNPNGSLDASFNVGATITGHVNCIAIQDDGRILIGGDSMAYNGIWVNGIFRLNSDGSLDGGFSTGSGLIGGVYTISIQEDSKIVVGGYLDYYNGTPCEGVIRLNMNGDLDFSFSPGQNVNGLVYTTAIQSDGNIIVGGDFTSYNGMPLNYITRLSENGSLDPTFDTGTGPSYAIHTTSIQDDEKIIIGGAFTSFNGIGKNRVARLLNNVPVLGQLWLDLNENCIQDPNEYLVDNTFIVTVNPGNYTTLAEHGVWYLDSLSPGTYTATLDTTNLNWTLTCPSSVSFTIQHPDSSVLAPSFGLVSNYPCPSPIVSLGMSSMRRGFANQWINFFVGNENTATDSLPSAYVDITLDENISVQSSTLPFFNLGNNKYRVDVGTLYPGESKSFGLSSTVELTALRNQTLCLKAELFPQADCIFDTIESPFLTPYPYISPCNSPWDSSSIEISGSCVGDSVTFVVNNNGLGDMQCYTPTRLYINGTLVHNDSILLNAGDSMILVYFGNAQTLRLEVDQHPFHPGTSYPNATVENCGSGNWIPGFVSSMPMNDYDPIVDIFCAQVSAPFDPNDKIAFPSGLGTNNMINANQNIEYMIRFQNIGTDTAVNVVVLDTLSEDFNIFSVVSGVSSHPYEFSIKNQRLLEWRFNNIMLPDSTSDALGSNGFVTFEVSQTPDLPVNTEIENTAYIYFDFEEAVQTNTYVHTIGENNPIPSCYGLYNWLDTILVACDSIELNGNWYFSSQTIVDTTGAPFFCGVIQTSQISINNSPNVSIMQIDSSLVVEPGFSSYLWTYDSIIVENGNLNSIVPESNGIYTVLVTDSNSCTQNATYYYLGTRISDKDYLDLVNIFPNPTNDAFRLKLNDNVASFDIHVIDMTGNILVRKTINSDSCEIDLTNQSSGVYWIYIVTQEESYVRKMVKK